MGALFAVNLFTVADAHDKHFVRGVMNVANQSVIADAVLLGHGFR